MHKKLLVGLLLAIILVPVASAAEVKTIRIGVLCDLSGPLSTYGNDIKKTLTIAEEKIDEYFKNHSLPYKVKFEFEDTQVNPTIALQKVQMLYSKGIRLIIGPMGSGEVANIKDYVTSNKIIIISPSSTAIPPLIGCTKPSDKKYIFRFVATDDFQTKAIADELKDVGIKAVVILYVGNAWGKGLYECIKPRLENYSIEIKDVIPYDQNTADFTPYIQKMTNDVNDLLKKYKPSEIGIVAFSYEEVANLLSQIPDNSPLFKVMWFGCDGCAKSNQVISVAKNKPEVIGVGLYSTLFDSKGPAYAELKKEYQKRGYGESPYQYALNAYDAAWVLCLAYVDVMNKTGGKYDPDLMAETIPKVTENYSKGVYGVMPVTGYIELNKWNDRASGDYAIWYVTKNCTWGKAGVWHYKNETITWIHKPTPPKVEAQAEKTPVAVTKKEKKGPGFEAILAIAGLAGVAYVMRRRA